MRKLILILLTIVLLMFGGGCAYGVYIVHTSPKVEPSNIYGEISQLSTILDKNDDVVETLSYTGGNRTVVEYDDIPPEMVYSVIAIEDKTFFEHHGFNYIRMIGAIKESITGGSEISGTSTITQQLARNVYLSDVMTERSINRKAREAYYTVVLEQNLSKKEIMEAYLNTVYFGFNCYGIETAAETYFNKSAKDLDLIECVALAALPQSPDTYALVKTDDSSLPFLTCKDGVNYYYNGDLTKDRRQQILDNMLEQKLISKASYDEAVETDLKDCLDLSKSKCNISSYYTDYVVDCVVKDIAEKYDISEADAEQMVYCNGFTIHSTMNQRVQKILEEEINDDSNYTSIQPYTTDSKGNILNNSTGKVMMYEYGNYIKNGKIKISSDEFVEGSNGEITLLKECDLKATDDSIEIPTLYKKKNGTIYVINGGQLNIPTECLSSDSTKNCVISATFMKNNPDFFEEKDGNLYTTQFTLTQETRQPQAAAAIIDNDNGTLSALVGGRDTEGEKLFNRATEPRQPGSSVKPIAIYGPALQLGYKNYMDGNPDSEQYSSDGSYWGKYITASSIINDAPMTTNGRTWPYNASGGYMGRITMRTAVQQSVNVVAVKVYNKIGGDYAKSMLTMNGVTTVTDDDVNPAALALGGMTEGISPLEEAAAYATFANGGTYREPICYSKVIDKDGNVILENKAVTREIYNEGVAWIMTDILKSAVSYGTGRAAAIGTQPVAGKTGTTSDQYDIWFSGFTPDYTMALWEGNDVHLKMTSMSEAAADFWSNIMSRVCTDSKSFGEAPSNVKYYGDYYVEGTR